MKRIFVCLLFLAALPVARTDAQIPDEFINLKVLPRDISKADLVQTMKGFTAGLGVRCSFCHVGEEGADLSTYDFQSDDKEEKRVARTMMTMTQDINKKYLAALGKPADKLEHVSCVTCHHGQNEPKQIEDIVRRMIGKNGVAAAAKQYEDLRGAFYGSFVYDFREGPLNRVARSLLEEGKIAEAVEILNLNAKYFPKSADIQVLFGDLYLKSGERQKALERYKKALELEPGYDFLKKRIQELAPPAKE
jgi:tetratricopeptide (TPR) repeat protein